MRILKQIPFNIFILSILAIILCSCNNSSAPEKQEGTQLTEAQAEAFFQKNAFFIAQFTDFLMSDMVESTSGNTSDLYDLGGINASGDVRLLKSENLSRLMKNALSDTVYYRGNGCWVLELLETNSYRSTNITGEVCFGSVDEMGYPLSSNNVLDYILDAGVTITYSDDSFNENSSINVLRDINMIGIDGFKNGSGIITVNGSQSEEIVINVVSSEGSFNSNFKITFTANEFEIDKQSDYPAGGGYQFQISIRVTETGSQTVSYLINGDVAFDGSQFAAVNFNGYDFTLDMSDDYL